MPRPDIAKQSITRYDSFLANSNMSSPGQIVLLSQASYCRALNKITTTQMSSAMANVIQSFENLVVLSYLKYLSPRTDETNIAPARLALNMTRLTKQFCLSISLPFVCQLDSYLMLFHADPKREMIVGMQIPTQNADQKSIAQETYYWRKSIQSNKRVAVLGFCLLVDFQLDRVSCVITQHEEFCLSY